MTSVSQSSSQALARQLALLLMGDQSLFQQLTEAAWIQIVEYAVTDGVICLLHARVSGSALEASVPDGIREQIRAAAISAAAAALLRDHEIVRVLDVLSRHGISVLILKGAALAQWLYERPDLRECSDVDLLFRDRAEAERASVLLSGLGYELDYLPGDMSYEMPCRRRMAGRASFDLDLHWRLVNAPAFSELMPFEELISRAISLPRLGPWAQGLGPVDALLHACLHRTMNRYNGIVDGVRWLLDLRLLGASFDRNQWDAFVDLCTSRGLCGTCRHALCATSALFPWGIPADVDSALLAQSRIERLDASRVESWVYMQCRHIIALDSASARARWIWQRMFPSRGQLLRLHGNNQSGIRLAWSRSVNLARRLLYPW